MPPPETAKASYTSSDLNVIKRIGKVLIADAVGIPPFFVQSKLWRTQHGDRAIQGFKECVVALGLTTPLSKDEKAAGVDYKLMRPLDSLLIHHPGPKRGWPLKNNADGTPGMMPKNWKGKITRFETWKVMEDLHLDRRVRCIGVCNFSLRQLREICEHPDVRVKPMVLQIEFHPGFQSKALVDYCVQNDIKVQAYASLGGTEKVSKDTQCLLSHQGVVKEVADELSTARTVSGVQVLLRWALQKGVCIIPKTSKPGRIRENMNLFDFELTQEQMSRIDELEKKNEGRLTWKGEDFDLEE
jgi:diketogulonate reductase-like aldo/keto reductase